MSYTKEQVIKMCREVHGDKYDYSITEGVQNKLGMIKYICPIHGIREQMFHNHLQGKECKECANISRKITKTPSKEEFLKKAAKKHNLDDYDWSDFSPLNRDDKGRFEFCCKKHGKYRYYPSAFLKGYGCPVCHGKAKDDEEVVKELSELHPELDFSKTKYSERDELKRIKVICPKHGEQLISYYNLKNGQGCFHCGVERRTFKLTISNEEFIRRGIELFGDKYSYEKVDMYNRTEDNKVIVTCKEHGDFEVLPTNFYKGVGCPICQESSLENEFRIFLEKNEIEYEYEKKFEWLGKQSIDFYLPKYNIGIECQGGQHFIPVDKFGGIDKLIETQKLDEKKKILCKENNIKLLYYTNLRGIEFPYDIYTNKKEILTEILKGD